MSIENLPADVARHRVFDTRQTCEFVAISIPHWRRLYRAGTAPAPIMLGARKLGWRCGNLIDWLDRRTTQPKVA
jgi:predicted DNA-binding transcriptional regulator AlpA